MLKSFEVFNFKSFKNETIIDLRCDEDYSILSENVKGNLLKGLLFIGPNASGKTNIIHALNLLVEIVNRKTDLSKFVNIFNKGEMHAYYTFEFDEKDVIYKLHYNSKTLENSEYLEIDGEVIFDEKNSTVAQIRAYFNKDIDNEIFNKFRDYIRNSLIIDLYNTKHKESELEFINPVITYNREIVEEINKFLVEHNFEFTIHDIEKDCQKEDLFFVKDDFDVLIPYEMESIGNKTLLYLLPIINRVVENNGLLLLDEFGSGMHNNLEELLIRYFMKNSVKSQILLVSHSTNLLSQNILRPDQIISVDNEKGSSVTFRFSTEKPRSSQNLEKMYLGGVFGGLPNYSKK